MAKPTTRAQFKDYCLRKLGHPVIQINVDDDQVDDRIDDALNFFYDYHYDGTQQMYLKHQIKQEDIDRQWIYCPDAVMFITGILPFDQSNSSVNMFDLRYQLRLHDLYDFTSVSYVSYEITMQHIRTLNLLFSGTPQIRFNRKMNRLHLDIDWTRDVDVGDWVIIECYRAVTPDTITLTGTTAISGSSNVVTGSNTVFTQEVSINDEITINSQTKRVVNITSDTSLNVTSAYTSSQSGQTATITGYSDVWNDRFLKAYATAKIKQQWGSNMKKFSGIAMPGGVTLNGKEIYDEASEELGKLEEDIKSTQSMPSEIFMG
jgi:sporulation protein YlmC with PRC-barrel domain